MVLFTISSCNNRKKNFFSTDKIKNIPSAILIDSLNKNRVSYEWLKAKANGTLLFQNESNHLKVNFRIKRDSAIWINLSKSSVQVLTCLISKDSVKFLKKIGEKEYFFGTYNDIKEIIGVELNYMLIQNFIDGNPIMLDSNEKYVSDVENDAYLLSSYKSKKIEKILHSSKASSYEFLYRCWINPENFKCTKIEINLLDDENTLIANYDNWKKIKKNVFPLNSTLTYINKKDTIRLKLNYTNNFKFNKLTFPFRVSNNYSPFKFKTDE